MPLWYNMEYDKKLNSHKEEVEHIAKEPVIKVDNESDISTFHNIKERWSNISENTQANTDASKMEKQKNTTKQDQTNFKNVKSMWQNLIKSNIEEKKKTEVIVKPSLKRQKSEYLKKYLDCTDKTK